MVRSLVLALLAVVAAGCTGDGDDEATVPVPSVDTTTGGPTTPGGSPSSSVTSLSVPQSCDDVIPFTEVVRIVAVPLGGSTNRVYADDFPGESGRTARLTCQYGVRPAPAGGQAPPPQVEIAVSGYVDEAAATARVEDTVGSARSSGQQIEALAAGGQDGFLIADAAGITYVAGVGDSTLVVTLARQVVPADAERVVLLGLAEAAMGVPDATPTPTPAVT
ncbi:MAG TPA: hypothetical protein VFE49_14820 [Jiangellaceae bacterium]|nr:hypothetical protein [Jiangellaceae bacterium]